MFDADVRFRHLRTVGIVVLTVTFAAMGVLESQRAAPLTGLHALPDGRYLAQMSIGAGLVMLVAAVFALIDIGRAWAGYVLAVLWTAFAVFAYMSASELPSEAPRWVAMAECAAFAAAGLALSGPRWSARVLGVVFGAMLVWFGLVHLTQRDVIASLTPEWIPYASRWPWVTGSVNLVAGLMCIVGFGARYGALAVAIMFALWLPIVHAPRLMESPSSLFEWTFALTAAGLVGVALIIAGAGAREVSTGALWKPR